MSKIIIIYSTTDGHTREICSRLLIIIEKNNNVVTLIPIENVNKLDLTVFDKIVIGASIRYGKHNAKVYEFINKNRQILDAKPNAFFSVNVVARKPDKNRPETNPYLQKFLMQILWKPKELAVFAGKIDYQKYKIWDRLMIRMIMWITKGPTDPKTNIEFTNWNQVNAFGQLISKM
ncbi:MAG: menaquinone-dependent protoporphyrinogen IX dehydrogenase [gamma proteobacterium symbiont of Lucinoma myriamae]|nr:menaquinone-dependent protoporphyrinogen IX dehydrogenase [gamma proteobacterium symbiont of Lucinoma myriamae]MCU7819896.1 menaquinone-dependent protoporphyrinogen IX dehydrogenase [gamma proteobacterium symbiont of Lucinoma myriamae]MCU7832658.1 menaquinone-dependent protoporphyrinogen IX dehydrogenase [gamma proteobacterium symbiont of Lucinoma myriamae]